METRKYNKTREKLQENDEENDKKKFTLEDYLTNPDTEIKNILPVEVEERFITASGIKDSINASASRNPQGGRKKPFKIQEKLVVDDKSDEHFEKIGNKKVI